jgi:hypothetical protein
MHIRACKLAALSLSIAALISACATRQSQVSTVDAAYVARLNGRLAEYNQIAVQLDADLKQHTAAANATVPAGATSTKPPGNSDVPNEVFQDAEAHARAAILTRFMHEAAVSGQIGLMSSWLQEQATELVRYSKDTDGVVAAFQKDAAADPQNPTLAPRYFKLLSERGAERGAAEELMTISSDVQGYAHDYAGAAAVDEQRRQDTVRLLAAYLSAPRVTVQAPSYVPSMPAAPTFTTCMRNVFGSVNCMTH